MGRHRIGEILAIGVASLFFTAPAFAASDTSPACRVEPFDQQQNGPSGAYANRYVDHGASTGERDNADLSSSERNNLGIGESSTERSGRGTGEHGNSRTAVPPC
jgi:hypothetical protein